MTGRFEAAPAVPNPTPQGRRSPRPRLTEQRAGANDFPVADTLALSIAEFCRRHGISRAHFYNLSKNGDGPALMRVGRRTLISVEAAAEWRRRMEQVDRVAIADVLGAGS